jgi:CubicO group peptidase (beta-lactamase class C family)
VPENIQDVFADWASTGTCKSTGVRKSGCGAVGSIIERLSSDSDPLNGFTSSSFTLHAGGSAADVARAGTANTSGLFEIASNTKVMTALVLEILVEERKIYRNDTLGSVLPKSTKYACPYTPLATVMQLASHAAGFPAIPSNFQDKDKTSPQYNPYAYYSQDNLIDWLSSLKCCDKQATVPNGDCLAVHNSAAQTSGGRLEKVPEAFYYSNVGFGMLGHVLEEKVGAPYSALLKEYIFTPLKMDRTFVGAPPRGGASIGIERVPGHNTTGGLQERIHPYGVLKGMGAVLSCLDDMSRFLQVNLLVANPSPSPSPSNFTIPRSLRTALIRIMQPIFSDEAKTAVNFGNAGFVAMGWQVMHSAGRPVIWKSGGVEGYGSFMTFDVTRGKAVVAFDNCGGCGEVPAPTPSTVVSTSDGVAAIHSLAVELMGLGTTPTGIGIDDMPLGCEGLQRFTGRFDARINGHVAWRASVELSSGCSGSGSGSGSGSDDAHKAVAVRSPSPSLRGARSASASASSSASASASGPDLNPIQKSNSPFPVPHLVVRTTRTDEMASAVPTNVNGGITGGEAFRMVPVFAASDMMHPAAAQFEVVDLDEDSDSKHIYPKAAAFQYAQTSMPADIVARLVWTNDGYDTTLARAI